jgi:hypothetical protein
MARLEPAREQARAALDALAGPDGSSRRRRQLAAVSLPRADRPGWTGMIAR